LVVDSLLSHDDFSLILLHDRYPLLILGKLGTVRYEDFPPHVKKQIQEGKYHGGVLERDDFDKGLYARARARARARAFWIEFSGLVTYHPMFAQVMKTSISPIS
jgi:hypothetical protein